VPTTELKLELALWSYYGSGEANKSLKIDCTTRWPLTSANQALSIVDLYVTRHIWASPVTLDADLWVTQTKGWCELDQVTKITRSLFKPSFWFWHKRFIFLQCKNLSKSKKKMPSLASFFGLKRQKLCARSYAWNQNDSESTIMQEFQCKIDVEILWAIEVQPFISRWQDTSCFPWHSLKIRT